MLTTSAYYEGVKIFSATKARERDQLGEKLTSWIKDHQDLEIVDTCITQSSDSEFHCLTITLFWKAATRENT